MRALLLLTLWCGVAAAADRDGGAPFHLEPIQAIGTTEVSDLSDVTWDGEKPCVAQGATTSVRCWDPKTKRWSPKGALPTGARSGLIVSGLEVQVGARSIRLSSWGPSSSNKSNSCTVLEGQTVLQRFGVDDGDRGKTFVPEKLSLSPSGKTGVALVFSYTTGLDRFSTGRTAIAVHAHGFRLWFFELAAE